MDLEARTCSRSERLLSISYRSVDSLDFVAIADSPGPNNCVGKRVAMMVLRLVLSYTVSNYRFEFAPGEDGSAIYTEAKDNLILKAGPLNMVFSKRM